MGISAGGWSDTDRLLSMALTLHERSKCAGGCGHYVDEAHDDDNDGSFDVEEVVCHACAAREQWVKDRENSRPEPGTLTWVRKLTRRARRHYTGN